MIALAEKVLPAICHVQEPVLVVVLIVDALQRRHRGWQRAAGDEEEDSLLGCELDALRVGRVGDDKGSARGLSRPFGSSKGTRACQ